MKYRNLWEPGTKRYRMPKRKPLPPEYEEILRRRLAEAEAMRRRKFPQFYKD